MIDPISDEIASQSRIRECRSLQSLQQQYNASSARGSVSPIVKFDWPRHVCRRTRDPVGDSCQINTIEKQVLDDDDGNEQMIYEQAHDADADEEQAYDADADEAGPSNEVDSESSAGEGDTAVRLPRHAVSLEYKCIDNVINFI